MTLCQAPFIKLSSLADTKAPSARCTLQAFLYWLQHSHLATQPPGNNAQHFQVLESLVAKAAHHLLWQCINGLAAVLSSQQLQCLAGTTSSSRRASCRWGSCGGRRRSACLLGYPSGYARWGGFLTCMLSASTARQSTVLSCHISWFRSGFACVAHTPVRNNDAGHATNRLSGEDRHASSAWNGCSPGWDSR